MRDVFHHSAGIVAVLRLGLICFLIEFAVPPFAESARVTPWHRHHIIERYGLLMIISMGEIVLSISRGFGALFSDHPSLHAAFVSVSALVIVFSIWWVYFCEEEHLVSTKLRTAIVWGYGHVFLFIATAALGAAIAASIDVATDQARASQQDVSKWLGGSLAVGSLALWLPRDRVLALPPRLKAALPVMALIFALAAALAAALGLPVWVFALLSVVTALWRAPDTRRNHTAAA